MINILLYYTRMAISIRHEFLIGSTLIFLFLNQIFKQFLFSMWIYMLLAVDTYYIAYSQSL